jgi:hypothetical protein
MSRPYPPKPRRITRENLPEDEGRAPAVREEEAKLLADLWLHGLEAALEREQQQRKYTMSVHTDQLGPQTREWGCWVRTYMA